MARVQDTWQKLAANERLAATGTLVVVVAWLVGLVVAFGGGYATIDVLAALALLVVYYLKYAPNQSINWPAPIQAIALVIAGLAALLALLGLLASLGGYGFLSAYGLGGYSAGFVIVALAMAVGAALMLVGTWREYQAMPR